MSIYYRISIKFLGHIEVFFLSRFEPCFFFFFGWSCFVRFLNNCRCKVLQCIIEFYQISVPMEFDCTYFMICSVTKRNFGFDLDQNELHWKNGTPTSSKDENEQYLFLLKAPTTKQLLIKLILVNFPSWLCVLVICSEIYMQVEPWNMYSWSWKNNVWQICQLMTDCFCAVRTFGITFYSLWKVFSLSQSV